MKDWKKILVSPDTSIQKTIQIMDAGALKIALVVDEKQRLLGTVSDGDVRRGILKGCSLEERVSHIMNTAPKVVPQHENRDKILSAMRQMQVYQIPVVDQAGVVVGLEIIDTLLAASKQDNWVVLMAGGLGSRLKHLTKDVPKPLLRIGDKPILETILESFVDQGFVKFFLSVNYKSELIESYFGDGSRWGVQIEYLREDKKLGTGGALGLLPKKPSTPLLVMNGDVLTRINFQQLLDFHNKHKSMATMCVREYDFQVPYGVVRVDKHRIAAIEEKPTHRFFVNAGIYVLEPQTLEHIPHNTYFDMPTLFERLIEQQQETTVFPVREYWLDVGRMDDFERAQMDFHKVLE